MMSQDVFGRTNVRVPRLWFGPLPGGDQEALIEEICQEPAIIDVSAGAGRYGHLLHGKDVMVCSFGGTDLSRATGGEHAASLLGAHLIETLSSIGRASVDFYFLRLKDRLGENVLNGALNCLDDAKNDEVVRFIGLYAEGESTIVQSMWQFHDAFEAVMIPRNPQREQEYQALAAMAIEKRVGLASCHPFNWGRGVPFFMQSALDWSDGAKALAFYAQSGPVLVGVRSADEVKMCREALDGLGVDPQAFLTSYDEPGAFSHLADHADSWVREMEVRSRGY